MKNLAIMLGVVLLVSSVSIRAAEQSPQVSGPTRAHPEEKAIPVPPFGTFVSSCVQYVLEDIPEEERNMVSAQSLVLALGTLCHCTYEKVSQNKTLTDAIFETGYGACQSRSRQDPSGFISEYQSKLKAALSKER